jgi:hypothetical protein
VLNNTSGGSSGGGGIGTSSSSNNNNGAGGSTTTTVSELTVTNVGREDTARYICFAANRHGESQGAIWLYVQGILSSCFLGYLCEMNSVRVLEFTGIHMYVMCALLQPPLPVQLLNGLISEEILLIST